MCPAYQARKVRSFFPEGTPCTRVGLNYLIGEAPSFFKGFAIDHEGGRMVYENAAPDCWPSALQHEEGCYIRGEVIHRRFHLTSDVFRQVPIFYFCDDGYFAASDSLFSLIDLRKRLGIPCSVNEEAVVARSWLNGFTAQLLSTDTPISGVYSAAIGSRLIVTPTFRSPQVEVERTTAPELLGDADEPHAEAVMRGSERAARLLSTFASIPEAPTRLALSGGMDSRVCLAAAQRAGCLRDLQITTNTDWADDYRVVTELVDRFSLKIWDVHTANYRKPVQDPTSRWAVFCAGVYDPLHTASPSDTDRPVFHLGGQGAEVYKGNFGWRTVGAIQAPVHAKQAMDLQTRKGLEAVGVDGDDPVGSEWHYLAYRNCIHSGRSIMNSMISSRPVLQRDLAGLSRSDRSDFARPKKGAPSIVTDMLIALSPELASIGFDDPKKNLSKDFIAERSRLFGEPSAVEPYDVEGSPLGIPAGASDFAMERAAAHGFTGPKTGKSLTRLARRGFDNVPESLKPIYEPMLKMAADGLKETTQASAKSSMAAGKLITFSLAD